MLVHMSELCPSGTRRAADSRRFVKRQWARVRRKQSVQETRQILEDFRVRVGDRNVVGEVVEE